MTIDLNKTRYRVLLVFLWSSVLYIGYILTNQFHLFTLHTLPLTRLDQLIPFLPWTIAPYLILVLGMYLFAFIDDENDFISALIALTIAVCINYMIYILYPTTYPRPPLPADTELGSGLYHWLTSIDTPANCFPSGHITTPAVGCWYLGRHHKTLRPYLFITFAILSLTTLTTKQHYIVDIPAGLVTASLGILIANALIKSDKYNFNCLRRYWKK
ncbi:hypothetical protein MNBD_GAMMA12-2400 [hydrothermal vent metagenome]|uniref:Inositolphosphotransferase Aur1/Ipt1 domain-containing protein n=1 Tax=hydrothermal vent metagenome TaxID=652676 RepID=A0A3B0YIT0_9ZZZZ